MCRGVELVSYPHLVTALGQPRSWHLREVTRLMLREKSSTDVAGDGETAGEAGGADTSNCDPASTGVNVNHVILYVKYNR